MTSTAFRTVSYSGRYTDLPPDFARCVLNAGLHVAVVDGVLTHEERRCTWFDRHVSLALMVEGAGHYQVEGATEPCVYQPGSCYLSCAWEKARGDDVFPAHIRRRIVLLQYCADWLSLFERGGYPHPAGGMFHGHPWRAAWVVRMPMPVELRQLAEDLLAHGAPEDPLARLKTESRALAALVTLAETLQDGHSHDPTAADAAPAEGGESRALTGRERRLLCTARSYIQTHCLESISVTGVANAVGLGEAALQNGFRALFGSTVYDYVLERRLAEAARLLREGAMSIGDVAWRSGFSHASHLARHFRRRYGMSPRDYRVR